MKSLSICIGAVVLNTVMFCAAQAQSVGNVDSTRKQLDSLVASSDPADREKLNERLRLLAASDRENDMTIAAIYYNRIKDTKAFDSIQAAVLIKFPRGQEARTKAQQAITGLKNLSVMESAYHAFIQNFPPESYPALPLSEDRLPYDRIRGKLAAEFAKEKNLTKVNYYIGLIEADFWKPKVYNDLSDAFYANNDLANAALYQEKAIKSAQPYTEGKWGNSAAANFAASKYPEACRSYAWLLYKQKNYNEALKYIETAVKAAGASRPAYNFTYAAILAALDRNQAAYDQIEAAVKSGKTTDEMWSLFKVLYVRVNGSDAGLDNYQAALRKGNIDDLQARLTRMMVNEPAADFTLTDLQGKRVKLADLKGKVVVLDFWATWCTPCKASFPAMQKAVDKYKNDPDVQFLFIHTWERIPDPLKDVSTYIASMKYSFHVLMDTKDPETKANKVVDSYNVTSIPAKFVIDKNGNIRFRLSGSESNANAVLDEISMMIDMIRTKG